MQPSQPWSWSSTGRTICTHCLPGNECSLPQVARLIDECLVESLDERVLWEACEFGASPVDLDFLLSRTAPDWEKVVASAARGGHLHVFRWMTERQDDRGPWEADFDWAIKEAARYGHLELIKWLRERVASCTGARVFSNAARYGQLEVLKWLHEQTTDTVASVAGDGMRTAAWNGHFATVQWIYEHFYDLDTTYAMRYAAQNGDLVMLQWLHQQKSCSVACSTGAIDVAVRGGHFRVAEWLFENCSKGCSSHTAREAAKTGNLLILQWLHKNYSDCFDSDVMDRAASEGHLEAVKWLHTHRSEGCTSWAMDAAAESRHLQVVRWLHENRTEGCTTDAMDWAARCGHLDIVMWLHENRSEGCTDEATRGAARNGHLDVLRWLVEHYPDKCGDDLMEFTANDGHLDVVQYLDENTNQRTSGWGLGAAARKGWMQTIQVLMQNSQHWEGGIAWVRCSAVVDAFKKKLAQLSYHRASPYSSLWGEALEALEFCHRLGCYSDVSLMLEQALKRGHLVLVQQFLEYRDAGEKRKYVAVAADNRNVVVLRWQLANGARIDKPSAVQLSTKRGCAEYVEVAGYLSEGDRVQLVCEAVTNMDWRKLLRWTLEKTSFNEDNSRATIRNAIRRAPNDTEQWLSQNLTNAEARKWCLPFYKRQRVR